MKYRLIVSLAAACAFASACFAQITPGIEGPRPAATALRVTLTADGGLTVHWPLRFGSRDERFPASRIQYAVLSIRALVPNPALSIHVQAPETAKLETLFALLDSLWPSIPSVDIDGLAYVLRKEGTGLEPAPGGPTVPMVNVVLARVADGENGEKKTLAAVSGTDVWRRVSRPASVVAELEVIRAEFPSESKNGLAVSFLTALDVPYNDWLAFYKALLAATKPGFTKASMAGESAQLPEAGAPSMLRNYLHWTLDEKGTPAAWLERIPPSRVSRPRQPSAPRPPSIIMVPTETGEDSSAGQALAGGPPSGFFGTGGNAQRVVYVVDRSGSMFDTFDYVRAEMKASISRLKPIQDFHVVFFAAGAPAENPPKMLVPATSGNRKQAFDYLAGIVAEGQTKPSAAIERAFAVTDKDGKHAQLIYLLTDGEFDPVLVKRIAELQAKLETKIKINTIGFIYRSGERILKQIAEANGGTYQFVSRDDLGR